MATKKQNVFADLQGLPTSMGGGEIYTAMKPVSTGVDLPASQTDREYKKKYDTESMSIDTEGFTIYVSLEGSTKVEELGGNGGVNHKKQRTPKTYFKFTIGESPTYSFYFGDDAPSYEMMGDEIFVAGIRIDRKKNSVMIYFNNTNANITITNKVWKMPNFADEAGTYGFVEQGAMAEAGFPPMLLSVAPYNAKTVLFYQNAIKQGMADMQKAIGEMNGEGEGLYYWNSKTAEVYMSPQSFTFDDELAKTILLPPSFDYDSAESLNTTDTFIRFNCLIENASLRTNNYTGYDPQDTSILMTTLQFPGDEALLAPMGTSDEGTEVACGLEAPEGRVLKSIKPVITGSMVQQVKLEFHDGSFCIFPDAETGLFTATDKETGQELQGRVENLIVAEGKWKESYAKEAHNRIVRNTNANLTIEDGETSAIAWRTKNPSTIKVIVPTDEGTKLVTIPLREA